MKTKVQKRRNSRMSRMRRRRVHMTIILLILFAVILTAGIAGIFILREGSLKGLTKPYDVEKEMLSNMKITDAHAAPGFAANLCVGEDNVAMDGITLEEGQSAALLNLDEQTVMYSNGLYQRIYPASMTKIMTAILALEHDNMSDTVTISQEAVTLEAGSQVCGFTAGDQVTMEQLLYGLLVYSGNDAASAIAETVGGTQANFVQMMNEEAQRLGMTDTHFTNPHGLHDTEHYTTPYDIYLMLNEAMKYTEFVDIIQLSSYTLNYKSESGTPKTVTLEATDHYLTGEATAPRDVTVLGGKTGTTSDAGNCLALVSQNAYGNPYVSIVTNASTKELLYEQMNQLLSKINR